MTVALALSASAVRGQSTVPGISSNGTLVTVTAPGGLETPSLNVNGPGAGSVLLQQGAASGTAPAGSVQITVPTTLSAYTLTLPAGGPDGGHPLLAFGADGTGYFAAMPASAATASQGPTVLNGVQTINGGSSSLPLVITSSNASGASIALDNSSVGGVYTLLYSNASKNAGLWDYTHVRDTFTCSQTDGAVSCGATHMVSTSGQPTLASGAGAGSGASAMLNTDNDNAPSDQSGVITVTTGASPIANAIIATVTFDQPWLRTVRSGVAATNYAPACTISAANGPSASLSGPGSVYAGVASRSSFSLVANNTPLASNATYAWTYKCM